MRPRYYIRFHLKNHVQILFRLMLYMGQVVELPDNVVRHLNVLRVRCGEEVVLFNGTAAAKSRAFDAGESACAEVASEEETDNESPLKIMLVQSVSSGERMILLWASSVNWAWWRIYSW